MRQWHCQVGNRREQIGFGVPSQAHKITVFVPIAALYYFNVAVSLPTPR